VSFDLPAARAFMAGHARLLDRRRFERLVDDGDPGGVVAAVNTYRNPDGGYGWGLEPDLRAPESQPGCALHAFEALADAAPATATEAVELCGWLQSVSLPDGGLPFALPIADPAACAPFWAEADPTSSSLQITAYVAGAAHRVAAHDPALADHPWLATATRYCLAAIEEIEDASQAIQLSACLQFLDGVSDTHPEATALIERLGELIPEDGLLPVAGGIEGETIRPLDIAPLPDRPVRALFRTDLISAELERLADEQQDDGGWSVDFRSYSPTAELEWRGYATVDAAFILTRN
jgi:hypothetical protein